MNRYMNQLLGVIEFELRRIAGSWRILLVLFFILLPTLIALLITLLAKPPLMETEKALPEYLMYFSIQIILPLICLLYGSAMFREELEDRSLTYLFIAPMDRNILLLGKYLATILLLIPISIAGIGLTVVTFLAKHGTSVVTQHVATITQFSMVAVLGVLAYSAVFTFLGLLLRRAMIAGIIYIVVFEMILSKIQQIAIYKATILHQLTNLVQVDSLVNLSTPFAAALKKNWSTSTPSTALNTLLIMTVLFMGISAYLLRTQEWESKPRE